MFRGADLRLVGDKCLSSLTRALRNDILAFCSPKWTPASSQDLASLGEKQLDSIGVAIRRKALPFSGAPDWSSGHGAIDCAFGLNRELHLFRTEQSIDWATFTEPQFTKGLAHFLNSSDPAMRVERVRALLRALGVSEHAGDLDRIEVTAEAKIEDGRRIDLLLKWQDSSGKSCAVAIEAKLGHQVTKGQLPAYRNHLKKIAGDDALRLFVISPRRTGKTEGSLRRNKEWRWISWHGFLVAHERSLPDNFDDQRYREFRRTLWDQTG